MTLRDLTLSADELSEHLRLLETERRLALTTPLANDASYMTDLDDEITATSRARTTAAVTEIARDAHTDCRSRTTADPEPYRPASVRTSCLPRRV